MFNLADESYTQMLEEATARELSLISPRDAGKSQSYCHIVEGGSKKVISLLA